jgi:hypothetical protein
MVCHSITADTAVLLALAAAFFAGWVVRAVIGRAADPARSFDNTGDEHAEHLGIGSSFHGEGM